MAFICIKNTIAFLREEIYNSSMVEEEYSKKNIDKLIKEKTHQFIKMLHPRTGNRLYEEFDESISDVLNIEFDDDDDSSFTTPFLLKLFIQNRLYKILTEDDYMIYSTNYCKYLEEEMKKEEEEEKRKKEEEEENKKIRK
jgi:hypothetical protein